MASRRKTEAETERGAKPSLDGPGARGKALRALARREHSAAELRHKLERRGVDADAAQAVVEGLAQAGWQSDTRYASMLVRSRIAQGYGRLRIEAELAQAGIADADIKREMSAAEADWVERAAALQRRRFGAPPGSPRDWQKQYRYLASRGFESGHIRAALKGRFASEE